MRALVVDAPTACAWLLPSPGSLAATQLLRASDRGDVALHACAGLPTRVAGRMVELARRQAGLGPRHLAMALETLGALPLHYQPEPPLLPAATTLAARADYTLEQALAVALALAHGLPLYTVDRALVRLAATAAGAAVHPIEEFWPGEPTSGGQAGR